MEVDDLEVEQPEVETSIEDDIRSAMASLKTDAEATPSEPVIEKTRDETGKFAAKTAETTPKRETLTTPEKTGNVNAPVVEVPSPAALAATIKAPEGLKPELREKFNTLPPEWQAEFSRREAEATKKITANDEERVFGKNIKEIVSPYLPTIRAENGTPEKAIESLLQTAHTLRQGNDYQKAQSVAGVMQAFKVDPNILLSILQGGNVVPGGGSPQGPNPAYDALQRELSDMKGQLQGFSQQRQLQEEQNLKAQIEDFSAKPGHEHFDRVRTHMGVLLENGIASDLEDAYSRAVYADPEIRSALIASQGQQESEKRLSETKVRTEAARRAGGSVSGSPGAFKALNGSGANVPIEETIRAALRESQGRV